MKKYLLFLSLFCLPLIGIAQTESTEKKTETTEVKAEPTQEKSEKSWEWNLTPDLWLMGMSGDISIKGYGANLDLSLEDILKNLKMAFMLHAEARHGKWGIMTDIMSAKLGSEATREGLINDHTVDVEIKQFIGELGASYTFVENNGFTMDAIAGGRYFDLQIEAEGGGILGTAKSDFNFFDPFVGVRLANYWNKFGLGGRFDVGGFGVGSDFTYKYNVMTAYQFSKLFQLELGYQGYKPDYKDEYIEYNVASAGFIIGGSFRF